MPAFIEVKFAFDLIQLNGIELKKSRIFLQVNFPPSIYYKISSHFNVADVGAFAPRNYVKRKGVAAKFFHNRGLDTNGKSS